jgi:O-antigen/teichoic acid export membrane protein
MMTTDGGAPHSDQGDPHLHTHYRDKLRFLLRNAAALVSTSIVTSGLGFIYWAVAARAFPASDVGESSTAISAMNLIAPFTVLGFGTLLMAELPAMRAGRSALVSTATLLSAVAGAVVALACAFLLPSSFLGLPGIGHEFGITALFAAAVATQGVGLLLDQALLSTIGGGMQLGRNVIQASVKLVLLTALAVALARFGSLTIFASWFIANVISIAMVGAVLMRRYRVALRRMVPTATVLHGLRFDAAKHHTLNISLFVPFFAMPIVANVVLGSEQAGYLYATWQVAGFVFFLPVSLATALFASGSQDSRTFLMEFRFTLRYSLLVCLAANIAIVALGGFVLRIFGPAYAANGRVALVVMCLGGLGLIVKDHHVAVARVVNTVGREALLVGFLSLGEVVGAAIGATRGGLTGLSVGWLAAIVVEAVVCGPLVWRTYRGRLNVPTSRVPADGQAGP